jgi:hypothetical protein
MQTLVFPVGGAVQQETGRQTVPGRRSPLQGFGAHLAAERVVGRELQDGNDRRFIED